MYSNWGLDDVSRLQTHCNTVEPTTISQQLGYLLWLLGVTIMRGLACSLFKSKSHFSLPLWNLNVMQDRSSPLSAAGENSLCKFICIDFQRCHLQTAHILGRPTVSHPYCDLLTYDASSQRSSVTTVTGLQAKRSEGICSILMQY